MYLNKCLDRNDYTEHITKIFSMKKTLGDVPFSIQEIILSWILFWKTLNDLFHHTTKNRVYGIGFHIPPGVNKGCHSGVKKKWNNSTSIESKVGRSGVRLSHVCVFLANKKY